MGLDLGRELGRDLGRELGRDLGRDGTRPGTIWNETWEVRTYLNAQTEITSKDGVLLRDSRVIIPTALRARVLNILHLTHIRIVRMKSLARMHVWWPNIEVDIAAHCKDCTACVETGPNQPENLSTWPVPDGQWQRIHVDFAGPFLDDMWLVVMDAYSTWPHVLKLNKYPTSETTTSALDDLFAMWGRPETILSDNGPQFASKTLADWCNAHSIAHLTSAPFHPASNGEAERLVGVFKQAMKRAVREEKKSKHLALREFVQQYSVTPHCTTGRTPAELMLGHQMRSSFSVLQPRVHKTKLQKKSTSPAKPKFTIGAHVNYRDYTISRPKWVAGKVTGHVESNAKIGGANTGYEQVMGKHRLEQMNENGEKIADFFVEHLLVIGALEGVCLHTSGT